MALYVRKPSIATNDKNESVNDGSKVRQLLDSAIKKPADLSADFLKEIDEKPAKKYPFNRTTTPNSLREHLKETLVKGMDSDNVSETIQNMKDETLGYRL